jgi:nitroreductase
MEAIEAILSRRSIRRYTSKEVSRELIQELLEAAMSAPSAGNEQPWHFIVINDRSILDDIPNIHPYSQMLKEAPVAIMVCGDLNLEKYKGYWVQDCSAATQNILLAAHSRGLGAVWLGIHPMEERVAGIRQMFSLPEHVIPLGIVALGYPAEKKDRAQRFQENRVHHNSW